MSDLIAFVMIIAFIISIAAVLSLWSSNFFTGVTDSVSDDRDAASQAMGVDLFVSDVFVNTSSGLVYASIGNQGINDAELSSAIAYNASGELCVLSVSESSVVSGGEVFASNSSCPIYPSCDSFNYIQVLSTGGSEASIEGPDKIECY